MAPRLRPISISLFFFVVVVASSTALNPSAAPKAISDLRDAIVKGLGFQDLKVSGFDVRDALVGQSVAYEFDIEFDSKVVPIKLLEDVNRWDFVDLPVFRAEGDGEDNNALIEGGRLKQRDSRVLPVLPPFELAGPMELWIQDGDDLRLSLPNDVDAGALKKVLLSDGAVVTVKGARSVSLRRPLELPLPLNRSHPNNRLASGLLTIAEALRLTSRASNERPLLSLRIVGPTSISSSKDDNRKKLKLKRLAPGLVELSSRTVSIPVATPDDAETRTLWPLTSINGSDANLRGFEELLASVLGKKGAKEGSFKLLTAQVSARTYVKMGFTVEKKLLEDDIEWVEKKLFEDDDVDWSEFAEWKTRPKKLNAHYEVLARVEEGGKIVPERVAEVQPFQAVDSVTESTWNGNVTMTQVEMVHPPQDYFVL